MYVYTRDSAASPSVQAPEKQSFRGHPPRSERYRGLVGPARSISILENRKISSFKILTIAHGSVNSSNAKGNFRPLCQVENLLNFGSELQLFLEIHENLKSPRQSIILKQTVLISQTLREIFFPDSCQFQIPPTVQTEDGLTS